MKNNILKSVIFIAFTNCIVFILLVLFHHNKIEEEITLNSKFYLFKTNKLKSNIIKYSNLNHIVYNMIFNLNDDINTTIITIDDSNYKIGNLSEDRSN